MMTSLTADVIEDPDFSSTLTHIPLEDVENRDGRAIPQFGTPTEIVGLVRPKSVAEFEIVPSGQEDAAELYLFVGPSYGVENDDRIIFRNSKYRTVEQQINHTDDEFSLFGLIEDSRSTEPDTDSSDDSDYVIVD